MPRKGLSFTLTLVVVGVVLLMTALTVVTLGGSSLSNFFGFFEQRGDEAATEAQIQDACNQLKQRINSQYCDLYVKTSTYNECNDWVTNPDGSRDSADYMNETSPGPDTPDSCENPDGYDQWNEDVDCGLTNDNRLGENQQTALDGDNAYTRTASNEQCNWENEYESNPVVTVEGDTYNCLDQGYIQSSTCPAQ